MPKVKANILFLSVSIGVHLWFPFLCSAVAAAEPAKKAQAKPVSKDTIAATIGNEPVLVAQVQYALQKISSGAQLSKHQHRRAFAAMLGQLVQQRLAHQRLIAIKEAATKYEIAKAMDGWKMKVLQLGKTPELALQEMGIDMPSFQRDLAWGLSWQKYRNEHVTDNTLEEYFNIHKREYDGTKVSVRHILLRTETLRQSNGSEFIARSDSIAQLIRAGKMTFQEAAKKYSDASSGKQGGTMGSFPRFGVMEESIANAAFALKPKQVSDPVRSSFGVHLLEVTSEETGSKPWQDSKRQLTKALEKKQFDSLAEKQRDKVEVVILWKPPKRKDDVGDSP